MQEITREQLAMQKELTALDKVIALYDPDYVPEKAEEPPAAKAVRGTRGK